MKTVKKLKLNKEVVAQLNDKELQNVQGGFTYGLSMGYICKCSKNLANDCNDFKKACQASIPASCNYNSN